MDLAFVRMLHRRRLRVPCSSVCTSARYSARSVSGVALYCMGGSHLRIISFSHMGEAERRLLPNILITGTPGTGKTTTAELVAEQAGLRHINVGELVKSQQLHCGWDAEHDCLILDEDKVCDALEDLMAEGGMVVDHHGCDFFPERWFDLVIVLQTDNTLLYERLERRGYSQKKVSGNVECEIMHVIAEEARESYREDVVQVLPSNTVEELEDNVEKTVAWLKQAMALRC